MKTLSIFIYFIYYKNYLIIIYLTYYLFIEGILKQYLIFSLFFHISDRKFHKYRWWKLFHHPFILGTVVYFYDFNFQDK